MRGLRRKTRSVLALTIGVLCVACLLIVMVRPLREPVWQGHRLSEWLIAYDADGPFTPQFSTGAAAPFRATTVEIEEALDGIGADALPCLRYWLTAQPGRVSRVMNWVLERQYWIEVRFADEHRYRLLARTGFEAFNKMAQPLLPELIQLTGSPDTDTRMWAFQAAFLTEPDREVFMRLFDRATTSSNLLSFQLARHWMLQRFPADAEKAGIRQTWEIPDMELPAVSPFVTPALTDGAYPFGGTEPVKGPASSENDPATEN